MVGCESMKQAVQALQSYKEMEDYTRYFKEMPRVLSQLKNEECWMLLIDTVLQAVDVYLTMNNKVAATKLLTDYSIFIVNNGSVHQRIEYYYLLAATYEGLANAETTLRYLQKAKKLAEQYHIIEPLPYIYYHLSVYYESLDVEKSVSYAHKSVAMHQTPKAQLQYMKLLLKQHHLSTTESQLEWGLQYFKERPINQDTITFWRIEAQYLCARGKDDEAYAYLKSRLSDIAHHSKWCELLYEDICRISKRCYDTKQYIKDLKASLEMKKRVLKTDNRERLQLLERYFDDTALKEIAWHDPLTSIPNRRYLEDIYPQLHVPFSAFLLDVDHFKTINDTAGHLIGDQVLKQIAQAIRAVLPTEGTHFVRLGGDEFFGIVSLQPSQLKALAKKIIDAVQHVHVLAHHQTIVPTVSMGMCYMTKKRTLEDTIQQADKALYEAKKNGRNQFVLQSEVLE